MKANLLTQRAGEVSCWRRNRQDMNLPAEMLGPVSHNPNAKSADLKGATTGIVNHELSFQKRVVCQLVEDTEERLALFLRGKTEPLQHRGIDGVCVGRNHLPSEDRRSCVSRSSAAECPCPARERSSRRLNSACHSGSPFSVCQLRYAARSSRSSTESSSTARFNSATLMLDTICYRFHPVNLNVRRPR